MPLFTLQDRAALVRYLRHQVESHTLAAHLAAEHGSPTSALYEQAEAEQLAHWVAGLEADLAERRLGAVDTPLFAVDSATGAVAVVPEIPGLTDGPVHHIPANFPTDESMHS